MADQVASDDKKAGAEVYSGNEICRKKTMELVEQVGLPNGLIPLDDIQECGYVKETGFVWMKWKVKHEFRAIGRLVQYDTEISGYKMKEVSGVESKKLREWITISEISIDDAASAVKSKELDEWNTISAALSGVKSKELRQWINIESEGRSSNLALLKRG